jgi:hypothetical protein
MITKSGPQISAMKAKEHEKQNCNNLDGTVSPKCSKVSGDCLSVVHSAVVTGAVESMILPQLEYDKDFDDFQGINFYDDVDIVDYDILNITEDGVIVSSFYFVLFR